MSLIAYFAAHAPTSGSQSAWERFMQVMEDAIEEGDVEPTAGDLAQMEAWRADAPYRRALAAALALALVRGDAIPVLA